MVKTLMLFALIGLCGMAGRQYARRYARRTKLMSEMGLFLEGVRTDVMVKNMTILASLKGAGEGSMADFARSVAEVMEREPAMSVERAWELGDLSGLQKRDGLTLREAGRGVGLMCAAMKDAALAELIERVRREAGELKSVQAAKTKTYSMMGFLIGIFIAVILA